MNEERDVEIAELRETVKRLQAEQEPLLERMRAAHAVLSALPEWDGKLPYSHERLEAERNEILAVRAVLPVGRKLLRAQQRLEKLELEQAKREVPQKPARIEGLVLNPKRTHKQTERRGGTMSKSKALS